METIAQEAKRAKVVEWIGWVVLDSDGYIFEWAFDYSKTGAIKEFLRHRKYTWKQWYRKGVRCVKATKTISTT